MKVKYVIGAAIIALEMTLPAPGMQNVVASPYGVCAHVGCPGEFELREQEFEKMRAAGIGWVRSDFLWKDIEPQKGVYRFDRFDELMKSARKHGIRVLPILCYDNPRVYPGYAWQHPKEWCDYVEAVVKRYRGDLEVVEVWNEPNISFWKPKPDVAQYASFLKLSYEKVKAVAPEIRVMMGGTAGINVSFYSGIYAAGGANFMDIVNVHPYSHPYAPETQLVPYLDGVNKAIADNGGRQSLWITEVGWPTHRPVMSNPSIIRAALETARPGQKRWNVVLADTCANGQTPNEKFARAIEETLDGFVRIEACDAKRTRERLAAGGVDAVFFPFDESYPKDSADAVFAFVERGGTLLQFGGFPMYRWVSYASGSRIVGTDGSGEAAADRRRVGISCLCWWLNPEIPEEAQVHPTEGAVAAGLKAEPTGFRCTRFFNAARLKSGDEFVPLLVGRGKNGKEVVGAGVYCFGGEKGGRVAVCGLRYGADCGVAANESEQAAYTARTLAVATAENVEKTFVYELQAPEGDPFYSEHHFGICHRDLKPKPAYAAYAAFTKMRPAGSVQKSGKWHDENREVFFPRWDLPDGGRGGMIWTTGAAKRVRQSFSGPVRFYDVFGDEVKISLESDGAYALPISGSPLYWIVK